MNPLKVLMIEDNRGDVVLMEAAMRKAGLAFEMTVLVDGCAAVDFLCHRGRHAEATRPDLVLLDLKLPKKNGREVLDEVLNGPTQPSMPIVLLSSSLSELDIARKYGLPDACYIEKPNTYEGFVQLAGAIARMHAQEAGGEAAR